MLVNYQNWADNQNVVEKGVKQLKESLFWVKLTATEYTESKQHDNIRTIML